MKKIIYLLLFVILILGSNSCDDKIDGGTNSLNYITFQTKIPNILVEKDGSTSADINIYTTQVTSSDRTFSIIVDALSSADPASYTIPTSVTIPANSNVGVLTVSVSDINIGEDGENLILKFESADGLFTGQQVTIKMMRFCPFDINDFVGTWNVDDFSDYDGAIPTYQVTTAIHEGNTLVVNNLWESATPVYIILNGDDFSATIADQFYRTHSSYGEMRIGEMSGGSFSSCNMVINTSYRIYVAAGHFDKVSSSVWTFVGP